MSTANVLLGILLFCNLLISLHIALHFRIEILLYNSIMEFLRGQDFCDEEKVRMVKLCREFEASCDHANMSTMTIASFAWTSALYTQ